VVGVSVEVSVGLAVGLPDGVPVALIPQMVNAKTKAPPVAPITVCFKNSNLGLLKITPIQRTFQV
jgi:hypothetical protein